MPLAKHTRIVVELLSSLYQERMNTTLGRFLRTSCLDEGERAALVLALNTRGSYRTGGGASPTLNVRLVEARCTVKPKSSALISSHARIRSYDL